MAQYLLSVHGSDTDPIPDNVQELYAAVEKFNKDLQAVRLVGLRRRSATRRPPPPSSMPPAPVIR